MEILLDSSSSEILGEISNGMETGLMILISGQMISKKQQVGVQKMMELSLCLLMTSDTTLTEFKSVRSMIITSTLL